MSGRPDLEREVQPAAGADPAGLAASDRGTPASGGAPPGLTVRLATPDDVAAVRAFMLQIFQQDYGYGYRPEWHWDYDDLAGTYIQHPNRALFVVTDDATGAVVGTAGLRSGGPRAPTLPTWLVARYEPPDRVAQIVRVFTHPAYRRRGVARALTDAVRRFVRESGAYDVLCLHTEHAVDFWQAMGCRLVYDGRTGERPDGSVHFELDVADR